MDPPQSQYLPVISLNEDDEGIATDRVQKNRHTPVADYSLAALEWLSPLTPWERHQAVRTGRVDGVGNWLLHTPEFVKWHKSEGLPDSPVLLCYGAPGVGKTCLSSLVIDTLSDSMDGVSTTVAFTYCDFNAENEESAATVLGALLKQVIRGLRQVPEEVRNDLETTKEQVDGRGPQVPEILAMLVKCLSSVPCRFICIDALDEFPAKHRPDLWESLQHIIRECPNTRIFLTGRPHIRDEVQGYFPGGVDMIPISPAKEDIGIYVRMRLSKDSDPDKMNEELRADILRIIPEKMSEIFLLVSLAMDAILAQLTIYGRRQTLHRVANGVGLEYAYGMTLARIRDQNDRRSKLGMDALMWICHSQRPLAADELCHALGVEVGGEDVNIRKVPSIQTVLGCTLGLATIDEEASTVRLLHFTLHEYLGEPTLFVSAHSRMARVCLTYLNSRLVRELPPTLDIILSITPFLKYATCFWATHASMDITEPVKSQALQLLVGFENHISANILLREKRPWYTAQGHVGGFTGLHCIAFLGITDIARSMVEMKRWDLNGRDSGFSTPLLWAVTYGNEEVVKLLLEQGNTNPNLADGQGRTPLSFAADLGREDIVDMLLKHRYINPDLPDNEGRTPLSFAAEWGREDVVKLLLSRGDVNPSSPDDTGRTPLSLASQWRQETVMKLLSDRQAKNSDPPEATLPILTMNNDRDTATAKPKARTSTPESAKRRQGSIPPSTPSNSIGEPEPPLLLPEQKKSVLPSADIPATSVCTISRTMPHTKSRNKSPVPTPPAPPPPKTPLPPCRRRPRKSSDSSPAISFNSPAPAPDPPVFEQVLWSIVFGSCLIIFCTILRFIFQG
ncbi:hypothetical protein L873DRAFT_1793731 [Choiromyces venosus 120613-1]|uniref:Uncharacterized protein n=1 Tax=Choiromyces venosus 120613-1 TaxID=1336337 RepID=A0A3N4JHG1_9PEZI|nr:hypothetical protein L873DRAFT_1793731 [Choiromyces venosus 120613-1]